MASALYYGESMSESLKIDIKNGTVNGKKVARTCEGCVRLPVCWLVLSVKNAIEQHEKMTGTLMFDWKRMGEICDQFHNIPLMVMDTEL